MLTWCADARFDGVLVDNREAGRLAARHLLGLGHTRLGLVCGARRHNDRQRERAEGVREALPEAGLDLPDWRLVEQDFTLAGGRAACSTLLALAEPPTAIVGGIDQLAVGCLVEAQARGLAVPGDLSVVGIDNLEMAAHLAPALTTVHVPTARIGEAAARAVLARIDGGPAAGRVELPIERVVRQSSGAPRACGQAAAARQRCHPDGPLARGTPTVRRRAGAARARCGGTRPRDGCAGVSRPASSRRRSAPPRRG